MEWVTDPRSKSARQLHARAQAALESLKTLQAIA